MKTIKSFVLLLVVLLLHTSANATIWYVNINATGLNNGTSWANAYTDFNPGIGSNDTVWVANGVYKPTTTTDRSVSFQFQTRKVFGGFVGNETSLNQRDYSTFQTVLSGDIGVPGDSTDNSYHVVRVSYAAGGLIDGFKITGGNANSNVNYDGHGGGIFLEFPLYEVLLNNCLISGNTAITGAGLASAAGFLHINNCTFRDNYASAQGGALGLINLAGGCWLQGCSFYNNRTGGDGGAIAFKTGMKILQCIFSGNQATGSGGAMYSYSLIGSPSVTMGNSLFVGNTAASSSALFMLDSAVSSIYSKIEYCTFSGNKSISGRAVSLNSGAILKNSIVWGNETGGAEQINLVNGRSHNIIENSTSTANNTYTFDPQFVNPGLAANAPFNATDYNYWLSSGSPAIDTGTTAVTNYSHDLDGTARILGLQPDLGCYESNYCATAGTGAITASGDTVFCNGQSVALTAPAGTAYNWSNGAHTQTTDVYSTGTYFVIVPSASGCYYQYSQKVLVHTPQISISGLPYLCGGASTTLTASGNVNNYNWSNSVTTPENIITLPGDYYVTGTDSFGCSGTSDTVQVISASLPIPVITQTGNTLTTGVFASYQWRNNDIPVPGANEQSFTPDIAGNYSVTVTNAEGCDSTSAPLAFTPLGIEDAVTGSHLAVYPNPAKDYLAIDIPGEEKVMHYSIYDATGRAIVQKESAQKQGQQLRINLPAHAAAGNYVLLLQTGQRQHSLKFTISR
jgi:hypothetical protein